MKKRVLSMFMALALCLTLLPTAALADELGPVDGTSTVETAGADAEAEAKAKAGAEAVAAVQAMIDALPDALTEENAGDVSAMLGEIDAAMAALEDEERAALDLTQYQAAIAALAALAAAQGEIALYADEGTQPTEGSGLEGNPYLIGTLEELKWFRTQVNSGNNDICAKLTADITLSEWEPIGTQGNPYKGTFDGSGCTISGASVPDSTTQDWGLFGYIGSGGTVKWIVASIEGLSINCAQSGVIAAHNAGIIECCSVDIYGLAGSLSISEDFGLIAYENSGTIENCRGEARASSGASNLNASDGAKAAGIAFDNSKGTIQSCYFSGRFRYTISGDSTTGYTATSDDYAIASNRGTITNCYYLGDSRVGIYLDDTVADASDGIVGVPVSNWQQPNTALNSGAVTWKLNGSDNNKTDPWRQDFISSTGQGTPTLNRAHGRVTKNDDGSYKLETPHTHWTNGELKEFTAVNSASDCGSSGYYYLNADNITLSKQWEISGDAILCLNGKTLTTAGENNIAVKNGTLTLMDDNGAAGQITGTGGSCIAVSGGMFKLENSKISGNTTGVMLDGGAFTMQGGEISGNTVGVHVKSGKLTLGGKAKITDNPAADADIKQNILLAQGSKISFDSLDPSAKFGISVENQKDLSDPVAVTDATGGQYFGQLVADGFKDNGVGFELYLSDDGKTVMLGKQSAHTHCICGDSSKNGNGHTHGADITFQPWRETDKLPTSGNYYLTRNVTLTKNATLQNANVCLNGYTVTLSDVGRINPSGTTQLTDCSVNGKGKLESYAGKANGGVAISRGNKFSLYGGTLNGVKVEIGQTGGGTFNMYGGKITGNTKGTVVGQSKTSKNTTITINMYGGEISGNHISENQGGGVFVGSGNQFNMYGGTIQNNSAVDGGGVYIAPAYNAYSAGEMTICGDAVIQGNKAGSVTNNVSLPSGKQITISGKLVENAKIGVTTRANLSQGNVNIATATDAGWGVAKNFTSDNSAYDVGLVNDGKTVQLQVHSHQWKYSVSPDGTTITAKCTAGNCDLENGNGGNVTIKAPTGDLTYDGNAKEATLEGALTTGVTLSDIKYYYKIGEQEYQLETGTKPTNAKSYRAEITVGGVNASVDYKIDPQTLQITANPTMITYGDAPTHDGVTYMGFVNGENKDTSDLIGELTYTYNYKQYDDVGDGNFTITPGGLTSNNYRIIFGNGSLGVEKKTVTITWNNTDGRTYDDRKGEVTATANGMVNGDVIGVTVSGNELTVGGHTTIATGLTGEKADNYKLPTEDENKSVTYTVGAAAQNLTFALGDQTKIYGDPDFANAATNDRADGAEVQYSSDDTDVATVDDDGKVTIVGAGTAKITATAPAVDGKYSAGSAEYTLTVSPKTLTANDLEFTTDTITKTYDGDTTCTTATVQIKSAAKVNQNDVLPTVTGTYAYNSKDVNSASKVTFTSTESSSTNYILPANLTVEQNASITPADQAELTIASAATTPYGTDLTLTVSGGSGNGAVTYTVANGTGKATVSGSTLHPVQAGTVTVVATKAGDGNYHSVSSAETLITIGQADFTGKISKTIPIVKNRTDAQTATLTAADFFTANQLPDGAKITGVTQGSGTLMSTVGLTDGKLSYVSKRNISDAADETYTVTIATTNYTDITATLTFHLTDKESVTISGLTYTNKTYDGQPIAPTGALVVSGDKVPVNELVVLYSGTGTTNYQSADAPKNAGTYQVTYSVAESNESCIGSASYSFTIAPKPVTVAPKSISITKGDALPTFELVCNGLVQGDTLTPSVRPAFTCFESDGTTAVTANTAAGTYAITWTNADGTTFSDANYTVTKEAAGTLTITARGSSGGGGSSVTTYPVNTPSKTQSGSVTSTPKNASKGDTVTITVKPDSGFVLDGLTVTDRNGNVLKLTDQGGGKYTFIMPASKVEVKVTFMDDNTMLNFFVDVKADNYFYDAVMWAAEKGITSGTDATHFSPNAACTRAQIVTFLWRAAGSPEPKGTGSFADIPADSYYTKAVAWAVENGITGGTGDGKFSPNATCTREQAVAFLYRASGSPAVSGGSAFNDVAANAYYADAVAWAEKNEITGGIGGGLFGSGNDCTRAQIVTFLYRTYQGK